MKATIFKNDEFQTVGIKVVNANVTIFSWGITYGASFYSKTIEADGYTYEIMKLVQYNTLYYYYEFDFVREVCEINTDPRNMEKRNDKKDTGTFIDNKKADWYKQQIEQIIERIK
jgi:hypothetical protein